MPNLYEQSLSFEQELASQTWPEPNKLVSSNRKTGQSFRSLVRFCTCRTSLCEQHCYACKGPISWRNPIAKSIAVRQWIERQGVEKSAQRMATEIHYGGIFRWMDRGDFDPLTIQLANRLIQIREDVAYAAFSRNLEALKALDSRIHRIYSMDKTSVVNLPEIPSDIQIAYLKSEKEEPIPSRVNVVFPLNHRLGLKGDPKDCSFFHNPLMKCFTCRRCY